MGKAEILKENGTYNSRYEKVTAPCFRSGVFFDSRDLVQVKYELLRSISSGECTVTRASELFGISRESIYKNKAAYEAGGVQALIPKKTGPKGASKLTKQGQAFIDSYVAEHPSASASETNAKMREKVGIFVHNRTVERYLSKKRQGSR
ncbi:MAG: helix-turn-helix domain containing protein [Blautia sp.]|nr:helix-turn-helix domain containing protein [Blautia sp.]